MPGKKGVQGMRHIEEFIWIDGFAPPAVRSKFRVKENAVTKIGDISPWGFDGSSTNQAETGDSDRDLNPVSFYPDPIRGEDHILVLSEVSGPERKVHSSNARAALRKIYEATSWFEPQFGIEQEYFFIDRKTDRPLGWPAIGYLAPQGPYYCGQNFGQDIADEHLKACLVAGIEIYGGNSEVAPGQWEFQIGTADPLKVADDLWVARWILKRVADRYGVDISYHPKLFTYWNGSGCHTNYSTNAMRGQGGLASIKDAAEKLGKKHAEHIAVYGTGNEQRLTGKHETASIAKFSWGIGDRGASVRVNARVAEEGRGYLEDRRPAANIDPYKVCAAILETTLLSGFDPAKYGWEPDVRL